MKNCFRRKIAVCQQERVKTAAQEMNFIQALNLDLFIINKNIRTASESISVEKNNGVSFAIITAAG